MVFAIGCGTDGAQLYRAFRFRCLPVPFCWFAPSRRCI